MKILILLSRVDQTGMTTHTLDLGTELIRMGHEVVLLTGGPVYKNNEQINILYKKFLSAGFKVKRFLIPKVEDDKDGIYWKIKNTSVKAIGVLTTLRYLIFTQCDVIHAESPYMSFIPWLLRKKFVSSCHVTDLPPRIFYKNATHLIAVSEETKNYAMRVHGYKEENVTKITYGIPLHFSSRLSLHERDIIKENYGVPKNKIIIGLVGSIEKRKGHDLLLEAFSKLPQKIKDKSMILFLGSSKDYKTVEWLVEEINKYNLEDFVLKFEFQDPVNFYRIMDIFVLPSRLEGFAIVVIEAMFSGCCVIRSDTEGAIDQIENGINGLIFQNENTDQLSDYLEKVISDEVYRKQLADAGREKALNSFTSGIMAKKTLEVYQKTIKR